MFSAMKYSSEASRLSLINQLKLPFHEEWVECDSVEKVAECIETMVVRGAPAIGCSAAYGFAIDASRNEQKWPDYKSRFQTVSEMLANSRPTAVNLFYAIEKFKNLSETFDEQTDAPKIKSAFDDLAQELFQDDLRTCQAIGDNGADQSQTAKVNVLTHCNTGSLACAGYGTALGVIRSLHKQGKLGKVYMDETRPYLQGSRLTAFELMKDGIDATLICDSTAAYLMQKGEIDWVVLGADRICANGDTANKIGTYSVAVNARYHEVEFYVAAPFSTFDMGLRSGADIPIEQRDKKEVTEVFGKPVALPETKVYNPSFDVTPNELITGIITEKGVLKPPYLESISEVQA